MSVVTKDDQIAVTEIDSNKVINEDEEDASCDESSPESEKINHRTSLAAVLSSMRSGDIGDGDSEQPPSISEKINHRTSMAAILSSMRSGDIGTAPEPQPKKKPPANPFKAKTPAANPFITKSTHSGSRGSFEKRGSGQRQSNARFSRGSQFGFARGNLRQPNRGTRFRNNTPQFHNSHMESFANDSFTNSNLVPFFPDEQRADFNSEITEQPNSMTSNYVPENFAYDSFANSNLTPFFPDKSRSGFSRGRTGQRNMNPRVFNNSMSQRPPSRNNQYTRPRMPNANSIMRHSLSNAGFSRGKFPFSNNLNQQRGLPRGQNRQPYLVPMLNSSNSSAFNLRSLNPTHQNVFSTHFNQMFEPSYHENVMHQDPNQCFVEYPSSEYIVEYYEVDEMGNQYPISNVTTQSYAAANQNKEALFYGGGEHGGYAAAAADGFYNSETLYYAGVENPYPVAQMPPLNLTETVAVEEEQLIQPGVETQLTGNQNGYTVTKTKIEPNMDLGTDKKTAELSNFQISEDQLKSLAETVASLENQTVPETMSSLAQSNSTPAQSVTKVIQQLMSRKDFQTNENNESNSNPLPSKVQSALGINLDIDQNPEPILDRLGTKFSNSSEIEVSEESTRSSVLEANLAKAYSHYLQASEKRKRDSSLLSDDENDDDDDTVNPYNETRSAKKSFDIGLGISLDINYSPEKPNRVESHRNLKIKKEFQNNRSYSPDYEERSRRHPDFSRSPETDRPLYRFPNERDPDEPPRRRFASPESTSNELWNPHATRRGASNSPDMYDDGPPDTTAISDNDDDHLSSSPEAPALIEDDDKINSPRSPINAANRSPAEDSQSNNKLFDSDIEEITPRRAQSQPYSQFNRNNNTGVPSMRKPRSMFKYCNRHNGDVSCQARFLNLYPDYYEHFKNTHGLRNGIPCVEFKCDYVARGLDNFLNHIKIRHSDDFG